jgi:hypothetical protein
MKTKISMGNDEFILYIRKWHPECKIITLQLGKKIGSWLEKKRARKIEEQPKHSYWDKSDKVNKDMLPENATQFEFDRSLLPELYEYLDELGRDEKIKIIKV